MATFTAGLQTHIWNNQIKSILLLTGFPFLLLIVLGGFFAVTGVGASYHSFTGQYNPIEAAWQGIASYWHIAFLAAGVWFAIAWFSHASMIKAITHSRSLTRKEAPEIYNMLENLCISRGMTMPKLQIMETGQLNAFASGISDESYTVTLTRGIIEALDEEELEAVIAHELSHIRHKDVRLLIISVIFVGILSFLCQMIYRSMLYGGQRRNRDGRLVLFGIAVAAIGYVLAIAIRFALSRKREYLADAGAVELTRNPDAMIRALQKISGRAELKNMPDDVKQMCIENASGFLGGMFATHPPIDDRIKALVALGGRVEEQAIEPAETMPYLWHRRHGPWG